MSRYEDKKIDDDVQTYVGAHNPDPTTGHEVEKGPEGGRTVGNIVIDGAINEQEGAVQRTLKQRHMAMIALGGAIGTGLFIGSGSALASGGPVGVWLGYILMSIMVYSMMVALGEMAALFPVSGAFTHYAARFIDPAMGFAVGFNYWYSWAITIPVEAVAGAIIISYWDTNTHAAVYITVLFVAMVFVNMWGARIYGESEFIFASIKVIALIGLCIMGVVLMCGGGPDHNAIGFRYWRNPGPFNHITIDNGDGIVPGSWGAFLAFWNVFVQAAFSFIGTEIIATTIGEAQNPRKTVPKAIKRVFWRLLFFYVFGIFVISVLVPYDHPNLLNGSSDATASPFVIAIEIAGIKALPSIANAVFLLAAWSAGNSDLYASSRTLYALALERQAPRIFRRCTKRGLPIWCVVVTSLFGFLAYLNTGGEAAITAFNWLYNLSAVTGIISWWCILLSYLRFYYGLKKQGLNREAFPYVAPFQPYFSWFGFIAFTLIILLNGFKVFLKGNWDVSAFFAAYITLPIFALSYFGWKVIKKTKWIPLAEIDFETGRRELDEMEERDNERYRPENRWQRIVGILF